MSEEGGINHRDTEAQRRQKTDLKTDDRPLLCLLNCLLVFSVPLWLIALSYSTAPVGRRRPEASAPSLPASARSPFRPPGVDRARAGSAVPSGNRCTPRTAGPGS